LLALVTAAALLSVVSAAHATDVFVDPFAPTALDISGDASGVPTDDGVTVSNTVGGGLRIEASNLNTYDSLSYTGNTGCTTEQSSQTGHANEIGAFLSACSMATTT
jgi:hypothetical protein